MLRFATGLLLICAESFAQGATPSTDGVVKITGRAVFNAGRKSPLPEFRVEYFDQLAGTVKIPKTNCLNAVFSSNLNSAREKLLRLNKQTIVAEGVLVDFMDYVNDNPISVTVSSFQNKCRNKYVMIVTNMTP